MMDFGLAGEDLGLWKGVVLTLVVGATIWGLWPDARRLVQWARHKLFGHKPRAVVSDDVKQIRVFPKSKFDALKKRGELPPSSLVFSYEDEKPDDD